MREGTQYDVSHRHQREQTKILNIAYPRMRIESTIYRSYNHTLVPLCHDFLRASSNHDNLIKLMVTGKLEGKRPRGCNPQP